MTQPLNSMHLSLHDAGYDGYISVWRILVKQTTASRFRTPTPFGIYRHACGSVFLSITGLTLLAGVFTDLGTRETLHVHSIREIAFRSWPLASICYPSLMVLYPVFHWLESSVCSNGWT